MSPDNPGRSHAADPNASPQTLFELAVAHPELRPIIASNPNAYPGLLEWLGGLDDPEVTAALKRRETDAAAASVSTDADRSQDVAGTKTKPGLAELGFGTAETVMINSQEPLAATPDSNGSLPATSERDTSVEETVAWSTSEVRPPTDQTRAMPPPAPAAPPWQSSGPAGYPAPYPSQGLPPNAAAWAGGQPPVGPPASTTRNNRWRIPLFILLGVLVVLAIVVIVLMALNLRNKPSDTVKIEDRFEGSGTSEEWETPPPNQPTPTPTPTPSGTRVPAPTPTASLGSATPQPPRASYPAPPGAVSATWFVSPTQNIACQMNDEYADCTIYEHYYNTSGHSSCPAGPTTIRVNRSGSVDMICDGFVVPNSGSEGVLIYDTSSAYGSFACSSYETGMSCWNTQTGSSFALAREGWSRGSNGRLTPSQFPW